MLSIIVLLILYKKIILILESYNSPAMRSWILAFAFSLCLSIPCAAPSGAESLPVRFSTPTDGAILASSAVPVTFGFELSPQVPRNLSAADGSQLRLCFTVQNKRESYQAFTTCLDEAADPLLYHLSGVMPGVWVARAYLTYADEPGHWRGGHQRRLGATEHSIWFLVEPETWQRSAGLNDAFEVPDPPSEADMEAYRRLRVLAVADAMVASSEVQAQVKAASMVHSPDGDGSTGSQSRHVAVTMANAGHLDLALNLLHSLAAHNVPTLVFTLDDITQNAVSTFSAKHQGSEQSSSFQSDSNRAMQLAVQVPLGAYDKSSSPPTSSEDGSGATGLSRHVDVWSQGFADIAVLKPACVWAVLRLGAHVLWLDTDIVVFANPFVELLRLEPRDLWIQAGGSHSLDVPTDDLDALRSELCTGLYFASASPKVLAVMRHSIHAMALHEHDVKFGDQSATNLVLHEQFRSDGAGGSIANVSVGVLSPLRYPTGGIYFEARAVFEEKGVAPLLVHNNYLIGHAAKVARFKAHNLWFVPEEIDDDAEPRAGPGVCSSSSALTVLGEPALACPIGPLHQEGNSGECPKDPACSSDGGDGNVLWVDEAIAAESERRLMVVVSLGDRPWFPTLVLPRLRTYASRVGADLLLLRALPRCFDDGVDSNACAKLTKLRATHAALTTAPSLIATSSTANQPSEQNWSLGQYGRVALIDDTMLVRLDAPNIFDLVPEDFVGAAVEDTRVRQPADSAVLSRLALLREAGKVADELLLTSSDSLDVLVASGRLSLAGCSGQNLRRADGPVDDRRFFNSGLLVLSAKHACLLADLPTEPLDFVVLWDQGLLNARRRLAGAPLHDLGLKLNWVGSFNGTNQHQRPCDATDAWAVHATTGECGLRREPAWQ